MREIFAQPDLWHNAKIRFLAIAQRQTCKHSYPYQAQPEHGYNRIQLNRPWVIYNIALSRQARRKKLNKHISHYEFLKVLRASALERAEIALR